MKITKLSILFFIVVNISFTTSYAQSDSILYSFFIAGHTYGAAGVNNPGLHPPFIEKFEYIQSREEIKFGVFTGDIVVDPSAEDWDEVDADIDSLGLPIYFAVGNHDMIDRPLFESRYGDTYFHFIYENDLFIILDPNLDEWNISGDQLVFLENVVDSNAQFVDNIFVFFHQILWWENDNLYEDITPNSFSGRADTINFWSEIEPIFNVLPNQVVFCSGDFGAAYWSDDFMYDTYSNITFIGSGMGEGVGDNIVVINIDSTKAITYDLICLNDTNLYCFGELTDYQISLDVNEKEWNEKSIYLFPNPANEKVTINMGSIENTSVQIISVNGQVIFKKMNIISELYSIDISDYPKGFYIVSVTNESNRAILKLIVK